MGKTLKYGSNAVILIVIVVAIAVVANLLVGTLNLKWDLTENKIYSIGDTTKEILKGLKKDIKIYGLFDETKVGDNKLITELLSQYKSNSSHITLIYKDLEKNPSLRQELDPKGESKFMENDFVVVCPSNKNKMKILNSSSLFSYEGDEMTAESSFTGAIKYVTSEKTPVVCFVDGHGEKKVDSDYTSIKQYLENNNYSVITANIRDKVPSDVEIMVFANPLSDLSDTEKENFRGFMAKGGKSIFFMDPPKTTNSLANFEDILDEYGIGLNYDNVKETDNSRIFDTEDPYSIIPDIVPNGINSSLPEQVTQILMPHSRSIKILKKQNEFLKVESLLEASSKAVGEPVDKTKSELQGPLVLAAASENTGAANPSKILVIGNSTFMGDEFFNIYGQMAQFGASFIGNSLNWMLDKTDDVEIEPKVISTEKMVIDGQKINILMLVLVIVFPLLILGTGVGVWVRRRHL